MSSLEGKTIHQVMYIVISLEDYKLFSQEVEYVFLVRDEVISILSNPYLK